MLLPPPTYNLTIHTSTSSDASDPTTHNDQLPPPEGFEVAERIVMTRGEIVDTTVRTFSSAPLLRGFPVPERPTEGWVVRTWYRRVTPEGTFLDDVSSLNREGPWRCHEEHRGSESAEFDALPGLRSVVEHKFVTWDGACRREYLVCVDAW